MAPTAITLIVAVFFAGFLLDRTLCRIADALEAIAGHLLGSRRQP